MRSSQYFDHAPATPKNDFQQLLAGNASPPSPLTEENHFHELAIDDAEMPSMLSQSVLLPLPQVAAKEKLHERVSGDENCQEVSNVFNSVQKHSTSHRVSAMSPEQEHEQEEAEQEDLKEFQALEKALRKETEQEHVDAEADKTSFYKQVSTVFEPLPDAPKPKRLSEEAEEREEQRVEGDAPEQPLMSGLVRRMFQPKRQVAGRRKPTKAGRAPNSTVRADTGNPEAGLRKKMEELEREIVEYQAASKELELQKKKVYDSMRKFEKMQSEIKQQQQEFTRIHNEKRQEFESWMEEETKKLRKERGHLERQKQRLMLERTEGLKDRKDRTEIESLKATVSNLRVEKDTFGGRMKGIVKAKEERIHSLESQVAELEKALALAEERRIDAWDKQIQLEATLIESQRNYEMTKGELVKLQQRLEAHVNPVPEDEPKRHFVSPNPKRDAKQEPKARVIKYKNGTVKKVYEDGTVSINFSNGDVSTEKPNGESTYLYKGDNIMHTTYPDGTQHIRFPDGQVEIVHQDGSREILRSND